MLTVVICSALFLRIRDILDLTMTAFLPNALYAYIIHLFISRGRDAQLCINCCLFVLVVSLTVPCILAMLSTYRPLLFQFSFWEVPSIVTVKRWDEMSTPCLTTLSVINFGESLYIIPLYVFGFLVFVT